MTQYNDKRRSLEKMRDLYEQMGKAKDARRMQEKIDELVLDTPKKTPVKIQTLDYLVPDVAQASVDWEPLWAGQYVAIDQIVSGSLSGAISGSSGGTMFETGDIVTFSRAYDSNLKPGFHAQVVENTGDGYYKLYLQYPQDGMDKSGVIDYYNIPTNYLVLVEQSKEKEEKARVKVSFDSVIISDDKRQQILEALEQINQSDLIFKTWGFNETMEKGKGVSILFYGEPGTGKTLMGQAIADHLNRKLQVISTADIESSAPGEAERNIRKYFDDAKGKKTILLFDECDSLIYTRKGVGPILGAQINQLLTSIEKFDGITIFTTNRLGILDEAVNRRLALKLEFPTPTREQRVLIWKRMFPEKAPLDADIDWNRLAAVEIAGGYIKNAVLRSVRMAAIQDMPDKDKTIKMAHLVKALTLETESMLEFQKASDKHDRNSAYVDRDGYTENGRAIHKVNYAAQRN